VTVDNFLEIAVFGFENPDKQVKTLNFFSLSDEPLSVLRDFGFQPTD